MIEGHIPGDGAGVGKGRTIAGIIYENYLQGRKRSLWWVQGSSTQHGCPIKIIHNTYLEL